MSSILNLEITQGDTMALGITITNELSGSAPAPDLLTVEFLVKQSLSDDDSTAVAPLGMARHTDTVAQLTIDDANAWTITVKATSAETAALTAGRYKCVCTTVDASGNTVEAFRGDFIVHPRGSDPS